MAAMLKQLSHTLAAGRLRTVVAVALLTVATWAAAVDLRADHPSTYVVQRGDTLWDIAGRFLQRPWLWPEIWQANPQIENPHLIYPGDVISLAYLDRIAVQPGPRTEAPITGIALADVEPFLKDLRVVDGFEDLPHVVGLEDDRLRGGQGQLVYARGLAGAPPGQRFAVLRPTQRYSRLDRTQCCDIFSKGDLDFRGHETLDTQEFWTAAVVPDNGRERLGYELMRVATGILTRGEVGGIEASTILLDPDSREVRVGDRIVPVEAQAYDLQFFPHPPAQQLDYGRARIMAVADMLTTGGPHDVVAISVGSREGVDNGTVFSTWRVGSNVVDKVEYGLERTEDSVPDASRVRLPDEFAGHVMVFRTFEKMSYALVMDSVKPTRVGYELKHPDAPY
jgi:LysM domain-containing protein